MATRTPEPLPVVEPALTKPPRRLALWLACSLLGLTLAGALVLGATDADAEGWLAARVSFGLRALGLPGAAAEVLPTRHFEGY